MSTGLSTAFITLFEAEVKQAYQGESVLNNSVRMRTNVQGSQVKFPKIGKGVAQTRTPQTKRYFLSFYFILGKLIINKFFCT